jgi:hypothetical protein
MSQFDDRGRQSFGETSLVEIVSQRGDDLLPQRRLCLCGNSFIGDQHDSPSPRNQEKEDPIASLRGGHAKPSESTLGHPL